MCLWLNSDQQDWGEIYWGFLGRISPLIYKRHPLIHQQVSCLPRVPGIATATLTTMRGITWRRSQPSEDAQQRGLNHSTPSTTLPQGLCTCSAHCQEHFPQISSSSFLYFIQVSAQMSAPQKDFSDFSPLLHSLFPWFLFFWHYVIYIYIIYIYTMWIYNIYAHCWCIYIHNIWYILI